MTGCWHFNIHDPNYLIDYELPASILQMLLLWHGFCMAFVCADMAKKNKQITFDIQAIICWRIRVAASLRAHCRNNSWNRFISNKYRLRQFFFAFPAKDMNISNDFYDNNTAYPNDVYCYEDYAPNENLLDFWLSGIVLNLVGIIGILGNILSMVILSRPQMRSSINYLLIGLARCDTVLIITSMLLFGFRSIYPYSGYLFYYNYYVYPQVARYVFPLATAAQTASIYLTLMVSLERYVAVCHPLHARALCTYGRSKFYVIFCIVFALLYNAIKLWEIRVVAYDSPVHGLIFCVTSTNLRKNTKYITIYIHWCYLIVNYFIPFIGLSIFNILIYNQVRKANKERQRLSRTEKREIGLATMLMCVVIVFFLFNLLALYVNIREAFYEDIQEDLIVLSNLLVTLNSSVNFVIYVIFGEKFKRIFLLLFCKSRLGRESPDGLMHDDSSFSNGDGNNRSSGRFSRHGTQRSTTATSNGTNLSKISRTIRVRAPSPAPCVYYPARDLQRTTTMPICPKGYDWDVKNEFVTSGFWLIVK